MRRFARAVSNGARLCISTVKPTSITLKGTHDSAVQEATLITEELSMIPCESDLCVSSVFTEHRERIQGIQRKTFCESVINRPGIMALG